MTFASATRRFHVIHRAEPLLREVLDRDGPGAERRSPFAPWTWLRPASRARVRRRPASRSRSTWQAADDRATKPRPAAGRTASTFPPRRRSPAVPTLPRRGDAHRRPGRQRLVHRPARARGRAGPAARRLYYVLVQIDSLYQTPDSNRANNTLAPASSQLQILRCRRSPSVRPRTEPFTPADEDQYFQVTVPAGAPLLVVTS